MRLLIADDHGLFRAGLEGVLRDLAPGTTVDHAATLDQTAAALAASDYDLVLLDLFMPGMDAGAIPRLREAAPATPLLVVSASEGEADLRAALAAGAAGYVAKSVSPERFVAAVRRLLDTGETVVEGVETGGGAGRLTPRQSEILGLAAAGLSNREIGDRLGITEGTVKIHMSAIMRALGARNRTEAVRLAETGRF